MVLITLLVGMASMFVLGACLMLVFHRDYHSGFCGTIGLGCIAVAAFIRATSIVGGSYNNMMTPLAVFVWFGLALYIGQVLFSFLRRSKRRDNWYPAGKIYGK